jgi:hypothetical protein
MQYGQMSTTSPASITGVAGGQGPVAERDATQLEQHLNAIRGLHDELAGAVQRAKCIADRLIGAEPESLNKIDAPKAPNPTALLMQLDLAQQQSRDFVQTIHYHLNRLERL